jgi:hypothetical protein
MQAVETVSSCLRSRCSVKKKKNSPAINLILEEAMYDFLSSWFVKQQPNEVVMSMIRLNEDREFYGFHGNFILGTFGASGMAGDNILLIWLKLRRRSTARAMVPAKVCLPTVMRDRKRSICLLGGHIRRNTLAQRDQLAHRRRAQELLAREPQTPLGGIRALQ